MVEKREKNNATDPSYHLKWTHLAGCSDKELEGSPSPMNNGETANKTTWLGNTYEKEHSAIANCLAMDVPSYGTVNGALSAESGMIMCKRRAEWIGKK